MNNHTLRLLLPLGLLAAILLSACAGQAAPQPSVVPTTEAVAPTAAPTAAPAPTEAPTAVPTEAPVAETSEQELFIPRSARFPYLSGTRSADGTATDTYWQNASQHVMKITVAPPSRVVSATQEITYTNASPYPLTEIFFRTYLNAHHPYAIRDVTFPPMDTFLTDGLQIDEFRVNGEVAEWSGVASETYAKVVLDQPLQAKSTVTFSFTWRYDLADANGWKEGAVDDTTFFLAYFYPRVAVLNDTGAWNVTPFTMGSEFYDDINDYIYEVTVPKNFVVWATGDLQNPDEVPQPTYAQRLKDSQTSDSTVAIATSEEVTSGQVTAQTDTVTWKWQADTVRDIAIGLSDHYNWDAGSVVVDPATKRRAGVHGAYPDSATLYKTIVEDGKYALTFASTEWPGVPYPYSKTSIFVGGADEEYPMMVNDSAEAPEGMTVGLVAGHEILHSWFPFYMGTDERRYPFMDEGWTTAFDYLLAIDVLGQEGADAYFQQRRAAGLALPDADLPVMLPQDSVKGGTAAAAYNQYGKAAMGYLALKDLMGDEAFKASLHEFIARWNGKHPLPWDMFNTFNATSSENLNWFFNNWFFSYNNFDIGVQDVEQASGGYDIQVKNTGGMAMPFDVVVTYTDATTETLHQTPAVWKADQKLATIRVTTTREAQQVIVDGGIFLDAVPQDNVWQSANATAATSVPAATMVSSEDLAKLQANAWEWISYDGPTEIFETANSPGTYSLTFNADGTLAVKADCNQAVGSYQAEGGKLTLTLGPVTAAACGDASHSEKLLKLLPGAALYSFDGKNLRIELMADGGTLTFAPAS